MSRINGPTTAEDLIGDGMPEAASHLIAPALAARGLILDGRSRARRQALLGGACAILTLLFFARMAQAVGNQRGNVGFLILLWVGAGVVPLLLVERLPPNGGPPLVRAPSFLLPRPRPRLA